MKSFALFASASLAAIFLAALPPESNATPQDKDGDKGWVQLFNGKDLTGWKTHPKAPGKWEVIDGVIVGSGVGISHLFSERGDYENFHFRVTAKINDKGNSGQYFRAGFDGPGYPKKGYEAQINSTNSDPVRTGSLYNKAKILEKLHEPDQWFTQEVIADGNRIKIILNGKQTVDYTDKANTFTKGHFAIQQHEAMKAKGEVFESKIWVKKAEVKELPPTKK